MGFNNFRINYITRTILLTATIFGFSFLWYNTNLTMTLILVGLLIVFQIVAMIFYVDRTNRVLNNFLESIRYSDFTRTFQVESLDSSFDKLKKSFNEVIQDFQAVRAEKEENYFYLQTVIQHIGIALIAFQKDGQVELINNATKKLFQVRTLHNIQGLREFSPEIVQKLLTIKHGENILVRVRQKDDLLQLAIYATEFRIHNRAIMLVSIKNIQQELDEKEMESWQKLIRVLTHEIMNSITPISSLSSTIQELMHNIINSFEALNIGKEETESLKEVEQAIQTIHKRTDGLLHFVNTYRNLTRIPTPNFTIFKVSRLLNNIRELHEKEIHEKGITCRVIVEPESLELSADEHLIEQVLINLLKNAIHALEGRENPQIDIMAFLNQSGRITIQVIDNGKGILPDVLDKIFIPFFTTKPQGSGIGLSLSRQIMRLHGGSINAYSKPGVETRFSLTF
ncbi:sensor histidine kinase [Thermophagus xiamenensis]|uniref:histidine kinase n=1 Tax=Thermophagus xiamenensis TaxID=385682 RepID=A0A1I2AL35_9BACT|nr:ATP-binding protein [Thermophagus xiamenensis]SFE44606.1 Histidine kinase-, DNA gyrase B-, and HSP90-like ATPase [Thermophagus xiamenensis]